MIAFSNWTQSGALTSTAQICLFQLRAQWKCSKCNRADEYTHIYIILLFNFSAHSRRCCERAW